MRRSGGRRHSIRALRRTFRLHRWDGRPQRRLPGVLLEAVPVGRLRLDPFRRLLRSRDRAVRGRVLSRRDHRPRGDSRRAGGLDLRPRRFRFHGHIRILRDRVSRRPHRVVQDLHHRVRGLLHYLGGTPPVPHHRGRFLRHGHEQDAMGLLHRPLHWRGGMELHVPPRAGVRGHIPPHRRRHAGGHGHQLGRLSVRPLHRRAVRHAGPRAEVSVQGERGRRMGGPHVLHRGDHPRLRLRRDLLRHRRRQDRRLRYRDGYHRREAHIPTGATVGAYAVFGDGRREVRWNERMLLLPRPRDIRCGRQEGAVHRKLRGIRPCIGRLHWRGDLGAEDDRPRRRELHGPEHARIGRIHRRHIEREAPGHLHGRGHEPRVRLDHVRGRLHGKGSRRNGLLLEVHPPGRRPRSRRRRILLHRVPLVPRGQGAPHGGRRDHGGRLRRVQVRRGRPCRVVHSRIADREGVHDPGRRGPVHQRLQRGEVLPPGRGSHRLFRGGRQADLEDQAGAVLRGILLHGGPHRDRRQDLRWQRLRRRVLHLRGAGQGLGGRRRAGGRIRRLQGLVVGGPGRRCDPEHLSALQILSRLDQWKRKEEGRSDG